MWLPRRRLARARLLEHAINLLQRQALRLGDEKVREENAERASRAPHEEDFRPEIALVRIHHVRGDVPDDEVPEPVGRSGQRDALCADGQWEDLPDDDPRGGTPGGGEEEDVEAGEDDEADTRGLGALVGGTHDGDDEFADKHADGAVDEERAAAEFLDSPEGDGGGDDVYDGGDHADEEFVLDADLLEESGAVIEDYRGLALKMGAALEVPILKLTPVHCCIIWRAIPRTTRRRFPDGVQPPVKQSIQLERMCFVS